MGRYKDIIHDRLTQSGWEVVEKRPLPDWWATERWTIQSVRQNWGFRLYLTYLVDPMNELDSRREASVWAVSVNRDIPGDRLEAEREIGLLPVRRRHLPREIGSFLDLLDKQRSQDDADPAAAVDG